VSGVGAAGQVCQKSWIGPKVEYCFILFFSLEKK
jgi:hypothetical protein